MSLFARTTFDFQAKRMDCVNFFSRHCILNSITLSVFFFQCQPHSFLGRVGCSKHIQFPSGIHYIKVLSESLPEIVTGKSEITEQKINNFSTVQPAAVDQRTRLGPFTKFREKTKQLLCRYLCLFFRQQAHHLRCFFERMHFHHGTSALSYIRSIA